MDDDFLVCIANFFNSLRRTGVPIDHGLTDSEFAAVEEEFRFKFPPRPKASTTAWNASWKKLPKLEDGW